MKGRKLPECGVAAFLFGVVALEDSGLKNSRIFLHPREHHSLSETSEPIVGLGSNPFGYTDLLGEDKTKNKEVFHKDVCSSH